MLSRTADSLFWTGRYIERAGNIARGMQVALRMAGLAGSLGGAHDEWRSLLVAAGAEPGFRETGRAATAEAVIFWLALDAKNPSSIANCIEAARRNGRAVRTALTVDMWEALNDTWRELRARTLLFRPELPRSLLACHARVLHALERIAEATGGRRGEPQRIAAEIHDGLVKGRVDDILARGLHDWLTAQIDRNIELGNAIQGLYLSG
jgi:uncharacterized alpha-E superfamily protein